MRDVCLHLQISQRKFHYLRAQDLMIEPVATIGTSLRFDAAEVQAWIRAGCPPADVWRAAKRADPELY